MYLVAMLLLLYMIYQQICEKIIIALLKHVKLHESIKIRLFFVDMHLSKGTYCPVSLFPYPFTMKYNNHAWMINTMYNNYGSLPYLLVFLMRMLL